MTDTFQQYGVHAEVRPDGELFLNASAVTLGRVAADEFALWLNELYEELPFRKLAAAEQEQELPVVAETPPTAQEQADADQLNNSDYAAGEYALETLGDAYVKPSENPAEEQSASLDLTPPPLKGPGSGADKWREFAALATGTDVTAWTNLKAADIQATLKSDGILP